MRNEDLEILYGTFFGFSKKEDLFSQEKHKLIKNIVDCFEKCKKIGKDEWGEKLSIERWHDITSIYTYKYKLCIDRYRLRSIMLEYINSPKLYSKQLDYFFIDRLLFAEYISTKETFQTNRMSELKVLFLLSIAFLPLIFLYKLNIYLFYGYIVLLFVHKTSAMIFRLIFGSKYIDKIKKQEDILSKMFTTFWIVRGSYHSITTHINFAFLLEQMKNNFKEHEIYWDQGIYTLIEKRISERSLQNESR